LTNRLTTHTYPHSQTDTAITYTISSAGGKPAVEPKTLQHCFDSHTLMDFSFCNIMVVQTTLLSQSCVLYNSLATFVTKMLTLKHWRLCS